MLITSELSIKFEQSRDYFLLNLVLSFLIILFMYLKDFSFLYITPIFLWLIFNLKNLYKDKRPHQNLVNLSYKNKTWVLKNTNDSELMFEKIKIRLDAGFFMLISLSGISKNKDLVVFYDQITKSERRKLFLSRSQ
jgi:hypothetical protein